MKEGRRCNSMCDSAGAVENFRQAVAIRPSDPDLLVCLSKSLSDRVFTEDVFHNHPLARAISKEAAEISERAIELNPKCAEAHLCLGAALGRLSMWSDNREKVELSGTIKERCEEAIRLDPTSDLALHVLGRYQHQMANLGRIVRALVRVMYGGKLEPGTLEEAEALFRRAVEIAPKRLIHRVELGKLLLDMQRKEEAHDQLVLAMTLPRRTSTRSTSGGTRPSSSKKHWGEKVVIPTFTDPPPTPPPRLSSVSRRSSFDTSGRRSFDDVRENPLPDQGRAAGCRSLTILLFFMYHSQGKTCVISSSPNIRSHRINASKSCALSVHSRPICSCITADGSKIVSTSDCLRTRGGHGFEALRPRDAHRLSPRGTRCVGGGGARVPRDVPRGGTRSPAPRWADRVRRSLPAGDVARGAAPRDVSQGDRADRARHGGCRRGAVVHAGPMDVPPVGTTPGRGQANPEPSSGRRSQPSPTRWPTRVGRT